MPAPKNVTLTDAVAQYVEERRARGKAKATVTNDEIHLSRFAREVGGSREMQLRNLTRQHIWDYLYGPGGLRRVHVDPRGRSYQPISASSHNVLLRRMRSFFNFCVYQGWTKVQPITKMNGFEALPEEVVVRQQPSPHLLKEILEAADNPRDRIWLALAINYALRQADMIAITIGAVDLDAGTMKVRISKGRVEKIKRIPTALDKELRAWYVHYAESLGRPLADDDLLIPHRVGGMFAYDVDGGYPVRTAWTYLPHTPVKKSEWIVQKALRKCGLETLYEGTHTIRRAVALAYYNRLVDQHGYDNAIRTVSQLLHHKVAATTERYLGVSREQRDLDSDMQGDWVLDWSDEVPDELAPRRRRVAAG